MTEFCRAAAALGTEDENFPDDFNKSRLGGIEGGDRGRRFICKSQQKKTFRLCSYFDDTFYLWWWDS